MKIIVLFSITLLALANCKATKKKFYETGELKKEIITVCDSIYTEYQYYKNGNLKSKGNYINAVKQGLWEEWYPNKEIKWEGKYVDGYREINIFQQKPNIIFESDPEPELLNIGMDYKIQIHIKGLHPEDLVVACTNGIVKLAKDSEYNEFILHPKKRGDLKLKVYAYDVLDEYYIGERIFIVK